MLRYYTAGESHGKALVTLVDGFPAGVELNVESIDGELDAPPGGIWPGRPTADRVRSRGGPQRSLAGQDHRQPDRLAGAQQRLQDRANGGTAATPARARRSQRLDQVSRLDPRCIGAGQRPRDGRPGRRWGVGQATAGAAGHHRLRLRRRGRADRRSSPAGHPRPTARAPRQERTVYPRSRSGRRGYRASSIR